MAWGYLLLILIPIAAIAYIVWDHRRKNAARDAERAGRLTELLGTAAATQDSVRAEAPAASTPTPSSPAPEVPPSGALYLCRERVLDPARTLLFYLLKTGLPDHVILARVTLGAVLDAGPGLTGIAREEQVRRLATLTLDFVVADRSMRPLAAIELATSDEGSAAQADRAAARTRLSAAGLRYLELDPKALPRKEAMRALVLGEPASAEAARSEAGVES